MSTTTLQNAGMNPAAGSGPGLPAMNRIAEIAAIACAAPLAAVIRREGATWRCIGSHGISAEDSGLDQFPVVRFLEGIDGAVVEDCSTDSLIQSGSWFGKSHGIRFLAGKPVIVGEGMAVGVLVVLGKTPRQLDESQDRTLGLLAATLATLMGGAPWTDESISSAGADSPPIALQLSERRLSALFRNSPAAIGLSTVKEGRIIDVNERYCDLLGYTREELLGRTVRDLRLHVETHDREAVMYRLLSERSLRGVETRFRRKDGVLRDIIVNLELLDLAGEASPVMVAQIVDITERKETERKLQQSQSMLRMASRVSRLGAWQVEIPDQETTWSEEARAILGIPEDLRLRMAESFDLWSQASTAVVRNAFEACVGAGSSFDVELRVRRTGHAEDWVRLIGEAVRDEDGRIVRIQGTLQDITQRRRDEEQLRLLEKCISRLSDIVLITDAEPIDDPGPRILYVNDAFERRTGYRREEVLGKTPRILQRPKTQRDALDRIRKALSEWRPVREELINYTKDGKEFWLELDIVPVADSSGWFTHWIAIERDISERKWSEEKLQMSEERFRLLAKVSNDVIWDWDLVQGEIWRNEGFEALVGKSHQGSGVSVSQWALMIHPGDRSRIEDSLRRALEGLATDWSENYRVLREDGSVLHLLDRGYILRDAGGRPLRVVGGMMDVTGRRQSEDRIAEQAALIDEARDAIIVRDLEGRVRFWSKGAERIHGWTADEAKGRNVQELVRFEREAFSLADSQVQQKGEWNGELDAVSKSNVGLKLDSRWTMLRDLEGLPRSILTIDTDVTERKKLEQQFLRAQRMDSIGTLAGGIAHDLNNVLAPILMSIELLQLGLEPGERQEILDTIRTAAQRGADMVRQVLSFARGVEGEHVVVQVSHLVRDVAKIVGETFPRNISVSTEIGPKLGLTLGDPTQIHQVLLNLCVNSRDAMEKGGTLKLRVRNFRADTQYASLVPEAQSGSYILIEVVDSGAGMSQETLDKIFDPFFTTKEPGKGTGLGLSTSLAIVRRHGGFMRVESDLGKGSVFGVYLPVTEQLEDSAPHPGTELPRGNGECILLVEDDSAVRVVTQQTLERFGYRVLTASDGAEAISIYARRGPEIDLVFTDMMMPVMDGNATIQVLLRMNPTVRVLAASGFCQSDPVSTAAGAGIRMFLAKPYTADSLLRTIQKALAADTPNSATFDGQI